MTKYGYVVAFERGPYGNDAYSDKVVLPWVLYGEVFYDRKNAETIVAAEKLKNPVLKHTILEVVIPK